jgi:hypothetical protein
LKTKKYFRLWLVYSISGLLLTGFGLSLLGEAIILKYETKNWFLPGTAALVVFNTGMAFCGQGVIYRVRYLRRLKAKESHQNLKN